MKRTHCRSSTGMSSISDKRIMRGTQRPRSASGTRQDLSAVHRRGKKLWDLGDAGEAEKDGAAVLSGRQGVNRRTAKNFFDPPFQSDGVFCPSPEHIVFSEVPESGQYITIRQHIVQYRAGIPVVYPSCDDFFPQTLPGCINVCQVDRQFFH